MYNLFRCFCNFKEPSKNNKKTEKKKQNKNIYFSQENFFLKLFQHTFFTNDTKSHFLSLSSSFIHLFLLLTLSILSTTDQKQS